MHKKINIRLVNFIFDFLYETITKIDWKLKKPG